MRSPNENSVLSRKSFSFLYVLLCFQMKCNVACLRCRHLKYNIENVGWCGKEDSSMS